AEQNFDLAVTVAESMVTTVANGLRNLTGVSIADIEDILVSAERAFDQIAAVDPSSQRLREGRATLLMSFAHTHATLGNTEESVRRARAAKDIMLALTQENPSDTAWQQILAASYAKVGDVLRDQGDLTAALTEYRAELDIAQHLAEGDPANAQWQS